MVEPSLRFKPRQAQLSRNQTDRYNLRFLTETNFIKLKRITRPQPKPRFKQTFITKLHLYQIFFFFGNLYPASRSEILTGNCSNLYSKRRHYSCYWTEYLFVEEVTLLQLFLSSNPNNTQYPRQYRIFFQMSQTICLFYLISPRQLELKMRQPGDKRGKHIIDETQPLKQNL